MNIPSYSSQDNNSDNMDKKKVTIIVEVVIAAIIIIGAVIAAILLGSSDNSINQPTNNANTEDNEVYAPEFDSSGTASCALGATGINPIACRRDHF